jgi:hypothetical protein
LRRFTCPKWLKKLLFFMHGLTKEGLPCGPNNGSSSFPSYVHLQSLSSSKAYPHPNQYFAPASSPNLFRAARHTNTPASPSAHPRMRIPHSFNPQILAFSSPEQAPLLPPSTYALSIESSCNLGLPRRSQLSPCTHR